MVYGSRVRLYSVKPAKSRSYWIRGPTGFKVLLDSRSQCIRGPTGFEVPLYSRSYCIRGPTGESERQCSKKANCICYSSCYKSSPGLFVSVIGRTCKMFQLVVERGLRELSTQQPTCAMKIIFLFELWGI